MRHNGNAKFCRIKHGIAVFFKQTAIIRQRKQTGNRPSLCAARQGISKRKLIIIRIHAVNGNFIGLFRHVSLHQTCQIHLVPLRKNAQLTIIAQLFLRVEQLVQCDMLRLYIAYLCMIEPVLYGKIAVLHVIFFEAVMIRLQHTAIGNQKAGHKANARRQQQEDDEVFTDFLFQITQMSFSQRIFHSSHHSSFSAGTRCSFA